MRKIFLDLKFFFSKLFSSKYVINGECKKCGACCRNIVFMVGENYVKTAEEFEKMKKFDKKYSHFFVSGKNEKGALLFTCKSLGDDNICKDYKLRSIHCRLYPGTSKKFVLGGFETFDTCGYKIEPNKGFEEYLR